jgi:hypothetical protein
MSKKWSEPKYRASKYGGYAVITYRGKRPIIIVISSSYSWAKDTAKDLAKNGKTAYILKQKGTYIREKRKR